MKSIVIYYSWSGKTKPIAEKLAADQGADICEVKDVTKPGKLAAYSRGVLAARRMERTPILPLGVDLAEYESFYILAPVWAGMPAPAINSVFDQLPVGAEVSLMLTSASGKSGAEAKLRAELNSRGVKLLLYRDVKS